MRNRFSGARTTQTGIVPEPEQLNSLSLYAFLPQSPKNSLRMWYCIEFIELTTWQHESTPSFEEINLSVYVCVCASPVTLIIE